MKKLIAFAMSACLWACSHQDNPAEKQEIKDKQAFVTNNTGQKFYLGFKVPQGFKPTIVRSAKEPTLALPDAFDWREKVALSPIESQGQCGSCWAFSTAATFQDVLRIQGENVDLSEQHLLSCAKPGEWSCNGGFFAHDRHKAPFGGVLASEYPYTASDTACKSGLTFRQKIASWAYLPADNNGTVSVDELKAAIYKYGPISVGVAVDDKFSNYSGGVFQDTGYRELNHAVNLVGWGNGYWIMRNSWGQWGENGYMRIAWGANGIGAWGNYVVYTKQDPGPNPDPTPNPSPDPQPCSPQPYADTGYGDQITVRYGATVMLGTKPRAGHRYYWTAEPAFDNGAQPQEPQIKYRPRITKRLTVHAVTKCGEAVDAVTVNMLQVAKASLKVLPELE